MAGEPSCIDNHIRQWLQAQNCQVVMFLPVLGSSLMSPSAEGGRDTRSFLASSHSFLSLYCSHAVPGTGLTFPC